MFQFLYWFKRSGRAHTFKPVILVTGCASGIGLALAKLLHACPQYRIVVTAREKSLASLRRQFVEDDRFWIRPLDVTDEHQRKKLIQEIEQRWQGVNVLVNNAGISFRAVVEHMTDADEHLQMNTNYFGPMGLIRLVLPHMRELGRGKILNVSSVSGMLAMPTMSSYSASKYALEGASEALWYETKPMGIDVCLIQPGFIHSNSFKNVYHATGIEHPKDQNSPYCDYYSNMEPFVEKLMNRSFATPEKVAKLILKVIQIENPPLWIPATLDASVFYYIRRMLPRRILLPFLFAFLPNARHWGKGYSHKRH